mmetsp:Transcript_15624/g.31135  ORF Transcript_15624/g.31135 Transcript_15624/m.31135 type:complete len:331 (-) Transcript_15624:56-1048(-)
MVVEDVKVPVDLSVFPPVFAKMTSSSSFLFWSEPLVVSAASPLTEVSDIRVSVALPSLSKVVPLFCMFISSAFGISDVLVFSTVRSEGFIAEPFCFDDIFVDVGEFVTDGAKEVVDLLAFAFVTDLPAFFDLETVFALLTEVGAIVIVGAPDFFDLETTFALLVEVGEIVNVGAPDDFCDFASADLPVFASFDLENPFTLLLEVGEIVTVGAPDFFDLETTFALLVEVGEIVNVGAPDDFCNFASADSPVFAFFGSIVDIGGWLGFGSAITEGDKDLASLLTITEGDTDFFVLAPTTTCVTCDNIKEQANKKKIEGLFLWNIMFQCSVKI